MLIWVSAFFIASIAIPIKLLDMCAAPGGKTAYLGNFLNLINHGLNHGKILFKWINWYYIEKAKKCQSCPLAIGMQRTNRHGSPLFRKTRTNSSHKSVPGWKFTPAIRQKLISRMNFLTAFCWTRPVRPQDRDQNQSSRMCLTDKSSLTKNSNANCSTRRTGFWKVADVWCLGHGRENILLNNWKICLY